VNRFIVREILYPLYRRLKRDRLLTYLEEMRNVQRFGPDEIRQFQWQKLKNLLEYAAAYVPYYRRLFKDLGAQPGDFKSFEDFKSFPILRKCDIKANKEDLVSEVYPRRQLEKDSTGGSTGENLHFYVDQSSSQARRANNVRMNEWIGIRIGDRTAMLWGTRFDVERSKRIKGAIRNWISNTLLLSAYRMDASTVEDYVARLSRFRPDLMIGYPSALSHFAREMLRRSLTHVRPRAVLVSGETLYEWQREIIEEAFQAKVYNHYGCREFGALARECRARHGLHLAAERAIFEVEHVADSATGESVSELLITDLDNYGMPFIRYAIEDVGTITWERCQCGLGLPRLESTIGRTFDVVRAPNGNYLGGTFWTILLRKVKGIDRFQVIQEDLDRITIAFIPTGEFSDEARRYVLDKIREACGPDMKVCFELKPDLELTPTAKHRFVISRIGIRGPSAEADTH